MFFWISQIVVFLLYGIVLERLNKNKMLWWISLIHFSMLAMLRAESVGIDTYKYARIFYSMSLPDINKLLSNQLTGFSLLLYPIRLLFPYRWMWMVISGLIPNVCVWIAIRILSKDIFLSIYLYLTCWFYFEGLNTGRQSIAIGLCMIALVFINKRYFFVSLLFYGLGVIIHPGGAILFGIIYPFLCIKWNIKRFMIMVSVGIIFGGVVQLFEDFFKQVFRFYSDYSYTSWVSRGRMALVYYLLLMFMLYSVLVLEQTGEKSIIIKQFEIFGVKNEGISHNWIFKTDRINICWIYSLLVTMQLLVCIILSKYVFISRLFRVIAYFDIFLISDVISYKTKYSESIKIIVILLTAFYTILRLMGNYGEIIPYTMFIN